jgi:DNA polymerase III delta prime subunit
MTKREEPEAASRAIADEEIDAVLYEAKGDAREAIRMLLHDIAVMASDADRLVSHGYVRGLQPWRRIG